MESFPDAPGAFLRSLRKLRGLTLEVSAERLGMTTSTLSRLERGERGPTREELGAAARVFELNEWEAYLLYTRAGFAPDVVPIVETAQIRRSGMAVLSQLSYPAGILDGLGYWLGWNGALQHLFDLPLGERLHLMDTWFSQRAREQAGDQWRQYVVCRMWLLYQRSLAVWREPAFQSMLSRMQAKYGADFVNAWNAAVASKGQTPCGGSPQDMETVFMRVTTAVGQIDYLVTHAMMRSQSMMDIFVYAPYGPENEERHRMYRQMVDCQEVYWYDGAGYTSDRGRR
jgi:transcriptional regulator with XRE-family HTH domain